MKRAYAALHIGEAQEMAPTSTPKAGSSSALKRAKSSAEKKGPTRGSDVSKKLLKNKGIDKPTTVKLTKAAKKTLRTAGSPSAVKLGRSSSAYSLRRRESTPSSDQRVSESSGDESMSDKEDEDWTADTVTTAEAVKGAEALPDVNPVKSCSINETTMIKLKKRFILTREGLVCPKEGCGKLGTLVLNGTNKSGIVAKCTSCEKKTTGAKLTDLMGALQLSPETEEMEVVQKPPSEPPITELLRVIKSLTSKVDELVRENKAMKLENTDIRKQLAALKRSNVTPQQELAPQANPAAQKTPPSPSKNNQIVPGQKGTTSPARSATVPQPAPSSTKGPASFAEAVRKNLSVNRSTPETQAKLSTLRQLTSKYRPIPPPPRSSPLYFRVVRGPLGELRRALRESLPSSALINMCFIGGSTLEILCANMHARKLIWVMNKARLPQIKGATPLHPHTGLLGPLSNAQQIRNATMTKTRAARLVEKLNEGQAKRFFEGLLRSMDAKLRELGAQVEAPVTAQTSNSEEEQVPPIAESMDVVEEGSIQHSTESS